MGDKRDLVSVFDYEAAAREKLPQTAYDYYRSGANDEITLRDNHAAYVAWQFDPTLAWKDVDWLCAKSKIPVLLKGVLHPEDARAAIDHGAAGVIVSNHGARQLDTVPATIDALPAIAEAVDNKIEVLIDGGIRRGTDVFKAIALGAGAVAVGRPIIWGLAVDGQPGAKRVLDLLRKDFELTMKLCGCTSIKDITPAMIFSRPTETAK